MRTFTPKADMRTSMIALFILVIFGQVDAQVVSSPASTSGPPGIMGEGRPVAANASGTLAAEIKSVDAMHHSMRMNVSVSHWQFDEIRSRYESLLKRAHAAGDHAVEDMARANLAQVARDERSAQCARTIERILAQSHERDREVAAEERKVAAAARSHARAFCARGYVQASTETLDGHKLYILIANDGSTIAYLDVPTGLDIDPLLTKRIGVRGEPHFNEDLGARLITVRDVEKLSR
jgi:hypothetical protein